MQNTCPNPGCGAMYNLTPQHVGRSFICKKCGATLHVTDNGLELEGAAPAGGGPTGVVGVEPFPSSADEPTPMRRPPRVGKGVGSYFEEFWNRIRSDVSTWLFGIGAVFTIICLFFPLLDKARILDREAALSTAERREMRDIAKDKDKRDSALRHWQEIEKPKYQEKIEEAKDSAKSWRYWYDWGTMWGFLFLAMAALGYLTPQQPTIRRVVGSIIFCAMMLLIFFRFVIESGFRSAL